MTLAFNAALVTGFWIFLPSHLTNWAFSLNGPVAFAVVLQVWMLADTLATNPFGQSREEVLARIDDPHELYVWLWARSIVVWSLVGPVCAIVALGLGIDDNNLGTAACACVVLLVLPFGLIAITAWVGILFPYHPRPLLWRWQHRRDWRVLARWAILLYVPYNLVLAIGMVLLTPAIAITQATATRNPDGRIPLGDMVVEAIIACVVILAAAAAGHHVAVRLARRRHARLVAYLADPDNG